jgi:hypothetical protein
MTKRANRHPPDEAEITTKDYPRIAAEWSAMRFVKIDSDQTVTRLVNEFYVFKKTKISTEQESKLRLAVHDLILAHSVGSIESYRAFRLPAPARLNPEKEALIRTRIGSVLKKDERFPESSDEMLAKLLEWVNHGKGLRGLWVGLCKEEAEIVVSEVANAPGALDQAAMGRKNAGAACPQPSFLFERDAGDILARYGSLKLADVYLLIQHSTPDPAYPYLCRFYWDEVSKRLLPRELCFLWVNTSGLERRVDF